MALNDLLNLTSYKKIGISEERAEAVVPTMSKYIAFWREYPDLFVDFMVRGFDTEVKENQFNFFYYQRVFLRAIMRYQYVYLVCPRAFSKSFLSVMALMIRCILYPGIHLFVTSGGKEQGASILRDKVQEICHLIPNFEKEIDWSRGQTQEGKDRVKYVFKNGSTLDNLAARESTRGQRRNGGLMEECVGIDDDVLREVIIPVMAIPRRAADGSTHPEEQSNKSQVYITTAGYKGTYPYMRLIGMLVRMVTQPDRCIVLGGTWRIPVAEGLQQKTFITDQKEEGTFNEASFEREFESVWSGSAENAYFNPEMIDRARVLKQPEYEHSGRSTKDSRYIIAVDVGRKHDYTVISVIKVTPQPQGASIKSLVNMYVYENTHFEDQCIAIKQIFYKYSAERVVIDGNGPGMGLVDYLVKPQINIETGETYPDFGVYGGCGNDNFAEDYKQYKTSQCQLDALYIVKANPAINTEVFSNVQAQLSSNKVKLLIDDRIAKQKLLGTKVGQGMTPEERAEYLKPFTLTSIFREETLNLREAREGANIILEQANKSIRKDKFSSFAYGLYYIKHEIDNKKKKKKFNAKDWKFFG